MMILGFAGVGFMAYRRSRKGDELRARRLTNQSTARDREPPQGGFSFITMASFCSPALLGLDAATRSDGERPRPGVERGGAGVPFSSADSVSPAVGRRIRPLEQSGGRNCSAVSARSAILASCRFPSNAVTPCCLPTAPAMSAPSQPL